MTRKTNQGNGLYAYLVKQGVLNSGDEHVIQSEKRRYWLEYKKRWSKVHRKECKAYSISFNQKELKIITKAAEESNTNPTNFIKQSALASGSKRSFINPVAVGEIRELLALQYNVLQSFAEEDKIPVDIADQMLSRIVNLERKVLGALRNNSEEKE